MKLRGKKILRKAVNNNYTKIPNELFGMKMNAIDKLVLMRLYYHREDYILAYTRLAQELAISKTTIKESWKRLKQNGFIVEQGEYYIINLNGAGNDPKAIGTESGPKQNQGTGTDPVKVRDMDVLGSASGHNMVQETTLIGKGDVPNEEETKEEEKLNKTKEEPSVVGIGGVVSDSATHPSGVAPSSPPPTQLSDERKKTVSKYTSNENERRILIDGFSDYLNHNPDSELEFSSYEDILMLVIYGLEQSKRNKITNWREVISLITRQGNIQDYNTHVNTYLKGFVDNVANTQKVMRQLRQQLIVSNK